MKRAGYALPEVLIAMTFFLLVMGIVTSSSDLIRQALYTQDARVSARQQARGLMDNMARELHQAAYLYRGYSGSFGGHAYSDVPMPGESGTELVFAVPENADIGNITYTVSGFYLAPKDPPDPRNPDALQVVYHRVTGVTPPAPDLPSSINPGGLGGGVSKLWHTYVPPGGFSVFLADDGKMVDFDLWFERRPLVGPVQLEQYEGRLAVRNLD